MDVIELLIIAVIIVVFVVMGPSKIPQLARALGSAKREYNEGAHTPPAPSGAVSSPSMGEDDLMVAARKLGISTEGKTREQISAEIVRKTAGT